MKQKNLMVGALVAALVMALWYMMLYSPLNSKASKANKAASAAQAKETSLRADLRKISPTGAAAKNQKKLDALLQSSVPKDPAEAAFLRQLNSIKNSTGVAFQSVTPSPPTSASGLSSIGVSITVQGSDAQVMSYLQRLEKLSRLFVTDNVTVTASGASNAATTGGPVGHVFAGAGSAPILQVLVTGRVFTQALVAAPGATATAVPPPAKG
jgi:Tfp pilus assembly protein PilO